MLHSRNGRKILRKREHLIDLPTSLTATCPDMYYPLSTLRPASASGRVGVVNGVELVKLNMQGRSRKNKTPTAEGTEIPVILWIGWPMNSLEWKYVA